MQLCVGSFQDLVSCLKQEREPINRQLLHVGVEVKHVPVLHQGGLLHFLLQHPAGEGVREGVGLRAARERTPLVQEEVTIVSPDPPHSPGPQGQEERGLLPSHTLND